MTSLLTTTMTALICSIVLLSPHTRGQSYCGPPIVRSTRTGRLVESKPEWKVEVYNPCMCGVRNLKLSTDPPNFKTAIPINPSILRKDNTSKYWIIDDGLPLPGRKTFNFTYVGDAVKFYVFHKEVTCPL